MKKRWQVLLSVVLVMVLSVSFSVPVFAASFSITMSATSIDVAFMEPVSTVSNSYASSGYIIYQFPSVRLNMSYQIQNGTFNALSFQFVNYPSVTRNWNSSYGIYDANGYGYWAIGPYRASVGVDDLAPIAEIGTTILPISAVGYTGSYCLFYVVPFYAKTTNSPTDNRSDLKVTVKLSNYNFTGVLNNPSSDLNPSDILHQTDEITSSMQEQTDTIISGYDNAGMESTNSQLSSSLTEYDNTESQVMDQSVQYIDAVTFFDPTTHLQLMSCITYTSTFLQNFFVALGDWSVLVLIALSLAFALMLIGWFKYRS